jgi:hypothetical protein
MAEVEERSRGGCGLIKNAIRDLHSDALEITSILEIGYMRQEVLNIQIEFLVRLC